MRGDLPDSDRPSQPSVDRPGFTDQVFDARYGGKSAGLPVGDPAGRTTAPHPGPHPGPRPGPTAPRSRNSFMRARARRSAASPLSGPVAPTGRADL